MTVYAMPRTYPITTTIDRWLLPHIAGILAYAEGDPAFAITLATWLDEENWSITAAPHLHPSPYLVPATPEAADDVIDWLMTELTTHPEARIARSALMEWAGSYTMATIATVANCIDTSCFQHPHPLTATCPTLQIIVAEDWYEQEAPLHLAAQTGAISQALVATELRKAGGKISSLHPHTAQWIMGGNHSSLETTTRGALALLHEAALDQTFHHLTERDERGLTMLALSPQIHDAFVHELIEESV